MQPDAIIGQGDRRVALQVNACGGQGPQAGRDSEVAALAAVGASPEARAWSLGDLGVDHDAVIGDPPFGADWSIGKSTVVTTNYDEALRAAIYDRADELRAHNYSIVILHHRVEDATRELDGSQAAKLLKLANRWSELAESRVAHADIKASNVFVSYAFVDAAVADIGADSNWLHGWGVAALPTLLVGFDRARFVELLREIKREKRSSRVAGPRPRVARLKTQLVRLAHAIVPNAPPATRLFRLSGCPI